VTNTTQETVVKAMELRIQLEPLAPMPTVCVVNTGLHDMAIPKITDSVYCENVVCTYVSDWAAAIATQHTPKKE
jgi:hypothetical protein